MTSMTGSPSRWRYLNVVGAANRWFYVVFVLFAAFVVYVRWGGGRANTAPFIFLFLVPVAAGTGLLTTARKGELDFLLGAGETRSRTWSAALVLALVVPALLSVLLLLLSGPLDARLSIGATLGRLVPVLLFTGGVAFAAGLVEQRYFAGVVWLLLRLIFVMSPDGLATVTALSKGIDAPSTTALSLAVILAPETLLEPHMPVVFLAVAAMIGIAALVASHEWFRRADLGGKRA